MPPSFASQEYWNNRFKDDTEVFEWLQPPSVLLPAIESELASSTLGSPNAPIMHIGPGSSRLSLDIRRMFEHGSRGRAEDIVNVDYAAASLELLKAMEAKQFGDAKMQYHPVDLMSTSQVIDLQRHLCLTREAQGARLVLDKSTADAIACGEDVTVRADQYTSHFEHGHQTSLVVQRGDETARTTHPIYVLAMHLAALTAPGALWLCMSYASDRLWFLDNAKQDAFAGLMHPSELWTLEKKVAVELGNDGADGVGRPAISHWLFHVRRTTQSVEIGG